jgi:hypothetical protein
VNLHFEIVRAGIWQATERPDIQLRKMPRTTIGRNGFALPGWAVFVGGREVHTCGREATKRHAAENAQGYVEREQVEPYRAPVTAAETNHATQQAADQRERHAGEVLALAGVTAATHVVKFDGTVMPREGIPCAHPEAARVRTGDVWRPDTCGGCGEPIPDADATPTLGPAQARYVGRSCCPSTEGDVHDRTCETDEARKQWAPRSERRLIGPAHAHLDAPCTDACYEPSAPAPIREALERVTRAAYEAVEAAIEATRTPPAADPATEDDVPELVDRIVRRARFEALRTMLGVLDSWIDGAAENHEAMSHRDNDCCRDFAPADIRRMVNDAAAELRVPEPYRAEVSP